MINKTNQDKPVLPTLDQIIKAEKILDVLERQKFADFYQDGGDFDNYIRVEYPKGHPKHITKEMILQQIVKLFRL